MLFAPGAPVGAAAAAPELEDAEADPVPEAVPLVLVPLVECAELDLVPVEGALVVADPVAVAAVALPVICPAP